MNTIAIIGAGASGLMAGIFAARAGADVTLYEHNNAVGKKILASGNGRCNIINTTASPEDYAGSDPGFASYPLKQLSFGYFEKLCLSIGILLDVRDDGRCYPLSNEAKAVQNALRTAFEEAGGKIHTDTRVETLSKEGDAFVVGHNGARTRYDRVLIATKDGSAGVKEGYPGVVHEMLSGGEAIDRVIAGLQKKNRQMEPFLVTLNPKQEQDVLANRHSGEEFIYVLEGKVEVSLLDHKAILNPGDSIYYDSSVPHIISCHGDTSAKILAVIYIGEEMIIL